MKKTDEPLTTGRLIEAVMKYRGMNYVKLAEAVGEHPINFCKVLNGNRNVSPEMAIKVAKVLNMSPLVIMASRNIEIVNNNE
ncbi:MAG: hypothetical protein II728_03960 [Bacteroidaceae bacterium]|nr:hypothetical protein [Bacteroidaceae bacterium]